MTSPSYYWKAAWEAEREAHRELRRMVGLRDLSALGADADLHAAASLNETAYGRMVLACTLAESVAVNQEEIDDGTPVQSPL